MTRHRSSAHRSLASTSLKLENFVQQLATKIIEHCPGKSFSLNRTSRISEDYAFKHIDIGDKADLERMIQGQKPLGNVWYFLIAFSKGQIIYSSHVASELQEMVIPLEDNMALEKIKNKILQDHINEK